MLRPKATKISLTRAEIRHLGSKEGFPRYLYRGPVSIPRRPDESTFGPGRDLPVQDAGFRTCPPEPRSITARAGSDESSFIQNARLSTPAHRCEQVPETVPPYGRTLMAPQPSRRLTKTPSQGSKASEGTGSPGDLTASAKNLRITESAGSPGLITESSPLDTSALHEFNTQLLSRNVGYLRTSRAEYAPPSLIMSKQHHDGALATSKYQSAPSPPAAAAEPMVKRVVSGTS